MKIREKANAKWDLLALGEVMLRLDPGEGRVATTRCFNVYEGGGEYYVARGLKRCFGLETGIVTALADNPVGRLVQDFIYQGGVDQSQLRKRPRQPEMTGARFATATECPTRRLRGPILKFSIAWVAETLLRPD
jgi:sugar/nucleoside kinase (ribokinase family)